MPEERVSIKVDQAVTLEGALAPAAGPAKGAALITHPHPLYGGSMDNNVVEALAAAAQAAGWAGLRFNFRGVGASTGAHGQGIGERQDVAAAAAWLRGRVAGPQALLGYSFGTLVAAHAAAGLGPIAAGVWVAPPLVLGELPPWPPDAGPLLVIAGERDAYTHLEVLEGYVADLGARGRLLALPEADHFFWGEESVLIRETMAWLQGVSM